MEKTLEWYRGEILRMLDDLSCEELEEVCGLIKESGIEDYRNVKSLKHSLCLKMLDLYNECNDEAERKLAAIIGVDSLSAILHNQQISEEDFDLICNYLKPEEPVKESWKRDYVCTVNEM